MSTGSHAVYETNQFFPVTLTLDIWTWNSLPWSLCFYC